MSRNNFCEDLKVEIERRTEELLIDESLSFEEKAEALGNIASYRLMFGTRDAQSFARSASRKGTRVAALVYCDEVPFTDSVFVGTLGGEEPIRLAKDGLHLTVSSGNLVRVYAANNGHNLRWGPTSRWDYNDEPVPVEPSELRIIRNRLIPATFIPSQTTKLADETLAKIEGLDHKICYEGINLPEVDEAGVINDERYDRMGILPILGREVYVDLMQKATAVRA